jgi:hypothetical protein
LLIFNHAATSSTFMISMSALPNFNQHQRSQFGLVGYLAT